MRVGLQVDTEYEEKVEDLLRASRKADEEDKKLVENLTRLVQNHDFNMYLQQVLGPRIQTFGATLLEPSESHDGMVRSEFVKGALYGLCLARDLASVIVSATSKPQEDES